MADYEAPVGPPPPKVPEGWVARWNDQYKEWFYVNTFTKKSQWDKPTEPAHNPSFDDAPAGPPPGYTPGSTPYAPVDSKRTGDSSNNPFVPESTRPPYSEKGGSSSSYYDEARASHSQGNLHDEDADARLARQLQDEEDARARGQPYYGGGATSPMPPGSHSPYPDQQQYHQNQQNQSFPQQLPARGSGSGSTAEKAKGLLGKFLSKKAGGHTTSGYGAFNAGYPGSSHGHHSPYPPQQQHGGYYGAPPPQPGYYGGGHHGPSPMMMGGGHHYGGGAYGRPKKSGGMGAAGGMALGAGAGLLGGALIADAIDDGQDEAYQEGLEDGADFDDGGGGDFDF